MSGTIVPWAVFSVKEKGRFENTFVHHLSFWWFFLDESTRVLPRAAFSVEESVGDSPGVAPQLP